MKKKTKKKEHVALSASRIKTLQGCTWQYYCNYILKLPDKGNLGSQLGSISHLILECLSKKKRKKQYDKCIKHKNIYKVAPITRLVKKWFAKYDIYSKENADKLNKMVLQGLLYDFFGKGFGRPTASFSELSFDLEDSIGYRIRGFIDRLFLYKSKKTAVIRDYKTSKKVFDGKDASDNLQDQMYSLAVNKLFPEYKKRIVEFPFLQVMIKTGIDAVIKMENLSEDDLESFEYFLAEVQEQIDNFSKDDAKSNMAFYKDYPSDGSFSGRLLCGFDEFKGQKKKDGNDRWGCGFKWPFKYYSVKDKKGNVLRTYFLDDYDKIEYDDENGEKLYIEKYEGCPAWNKNK